jgi:Cu(I)/Ag(I) efflux system membrane fusion protein
MRPGIYAIGVVAALIAATVAGFVAGRGGFPPTETTHVETVAPAAAQASAETIYYQDPDGKPFYSLTPRKTPEGRDYRAVPASADISFEEKQETESVTPAVTDRKVKFYRNPMGLPDTSPTPKKDSMGMDYIPVFEGEDSDDGSIKLSPGKIQRTGVKSEPAAQHIIRTIIRAPGTIQLDERRVSVISMRAESWILKVANVTTGTYVHKGQPLMEVYNSAVSSAAAEYQFKDDRQRQIIWPGSAAATGESRCARGGDHCNRE